MCVCVCVCVSGHMECSIEMLLQLDGNSRRQQSTGPLNRAALLRKDKSSLSLSLSLSLLLCSSLPYSPLFFSSLIPCLLSCQIPPSSLFTLEASVLIFSLLFLVLCSHSFLFSFLCFDLTRFSSLCCVLISLFSLLPPVSSPALPTAPCSSSFHLYSFILSFLLSFLLLFSSSFLLFISPSSVGKS